MAVSTKHDDLIKERKKTVLDSFAFELVDLMIKIAVKKMEDGQPARLSAEIPVFNIQTEEYIQATYHLFTSIHDKLNSLKHFEGYLMINPIPKFYSKSGIEEIDYYKYHVENYHVKFISVIDYTSLLINDVFELGIDRERCNPHLVITHPNCKDLEIAHSLLKLSSKFSDMKKDRHKIIHRGNFKSDTLENLDEYVNSDYLDDIRRENEESGNFEYFKNSKKKILKNTVQLFNEQIDVLEIYIQEIVSFLIPVFRTNWQKKNKNE